MKFVKQTITAHRGASKVAHENTIEAFQKAIELHADAIELDVRKTTDQAIIVHHDDHIDGQHIHSLTYLQLNQLAKAKGYLIPTLEDVLKFCQGKIFMDIEIKEMGYEDEIIQLVQKYLTPDAFFFRTFEDASIRRIKKINSQLKVGLLLGVEKPKYGWITRLSELFPIWRIIRTRCDFVSPYYRLVRFGYVKRMHLIQKPVLVWTVNDPLLMKHLLKIKKVDGIVTDDPSLGIEILKNTDS